VFNFLTEEGPSTSRLGPPIQQPEDTSSASRDVCEPVQAGPVDPADWPRQLTDIVRTELVSRGPYEVKTDFTFPKSEDGRSFHNHYVHRQLVNGEKIKRTWLMYSPKRGSLYCFCCKLFSQKAFKLSRDGFQYWKNCSETLKMHENSPEHTKNIWDCGRS